MTISLHSSFFLYLIRRSQNKYVIPFYINKYAILNNDGTLFHPYFTPFETLKHIFQYYLHLICHHFYKLNFDAETKTIYNIWCHANNFCNLYVCLLTRFENAASFQWKKGQQIFV